MKISNRQALISLGALATLVLPALAIDFYVYQNDGGFNAFHLEEVDSITYSNLDLDGYPYDTPVTQEVWIGDSVTRIPIANIDSVGFIQPEIIYKEGVIIMNADYNSSVSNGDVLSFTLKSLPDGLEKPAVGNVVASTADCTAFPEGIIARVTSYTENSDGSISYECEKASLDDVFDQIVCYVSGEIEGEEEEEIVDEENSTATKIRRRISSEKQIDLWDLSFNKTWARTDSTDTVAKATIKAADKASVEMKICKTLGSPLYANVTLDNAFSSSIDLQFDHSSLVHMDSVQIGKTISLGKITFPNVVLANLFWIEPQISLYAYLQEELEAHGTVQAHCNRTDHFSLTYNEGWEIVSEPVMDAAVDSLKGTVSGSVAAGLMPQISLALNGGSNKAGLNGKVGVKQTLEFMFDGKECFSQGVYESLRNTTACTYLNYATDAYVQASLFGLKEVSKNYTLFDDEKLLLELYIMPEIENTGYSLYHGVTTVNFSLSNTLLFPYKVSMNIYDEEDNLVAESDARKDYVNGGNYSFDFSGLSRETTYYAVPMLYLGNSSFRTTPIEICHPASESGVELDYCDAEISYAEATSVYYNSSNSKNYFYYRIYIDPGEDEASEEWGYELSNGTVVKANNDDKESGLKYPTSTYLVYEDTDIDSNNVMTGDEFEIDFNNQTFKITMSVRPYVKKYSEANGTTTTFYGDWIDFPVVYNEKPSIVVNSVGTISTTDNSTYYTTYFYPNYTAKGAFWGDYIYVNNESDNLTWTSKKFTCQKSTTTVQGLSFKYNVGEAKDDSMTLQFYLRNRGDNTYVESNKVNWYVNDGKVDTFTVE